MSRSDDEFVRRVSLNPANLATQSDPNTAQTDAYYHDNMAAAEDQEFRPIHRYTSGSQSEANTRRVSLSEARPKVAALVYLLQVLAVILGECVCGIQMVLLLGRLVDLVFHWC